MTSPPGSGCTPNSDGLRRAAEVHGWIRPLNPWRTEFTERARHEIAFDNLPQLWSDEEQATMAAAVVRMVVGLKGDNGWAGFDAQTRRALLASHVDLRDEAGDRVVDGLRDLADSMLQLSALELDAARHEASLALARQALRAAEQAGTDPVALVGFRSHLAELLVATGRTDEALPLLEEAVPASIDAHGAAAPETQALIADLEEAQRAQEASPAPSAPAEPDRGGGLAPFTPWAARPVPELTSLLPSDLGDLVCEVVGAEGPARPDGCSGF